MFSLCIPTMNRFDSFLIRYIPEYLNNNLIDEIIITDETGEDAKKIREHFPDSKIKVFVNEIKLGPFLNKLKACKLASQQWIALIDSDNFADVVYFETAKQFIKSRYLPPASILAPSWAKPNINYSNMSGFLFTKSRLYKNESLKDKNAIFAPTIHLMNTGNYILNKYVIDTINIENEAHNIPLSSACDVVYFNILLFEQMDLYMWVVPNLHYTHVVHDGSVYMQTYKQFEKFNNQIYERYENLVCSSKSLEKTHMTLREWQTAYKSRDEILYNCSEFQFLNDEWVPFTIGMEWRIIHHPNNLDMIQKGTHENLVLCAISPDTDKRRRSHTGKNRAIYLQTLSRQNIHNIYIQANEYFKTLSTYKFVISPEGNGVDCHRHYEALMAGCIPIIENHPGIKEKYKGCPILFTVDYSEITPEYLEQKYSEMIDTEYDFSKLFLSSYSVEEQVQIKQNGNYWSNRLARQNWYH
jgi:hypothetical protein